MTKCLHPLLKNQVLDLEAIVGEERLKAAGITIDSKFGPAPVINQRLKKLLGKKLIKQLAGT